MDQGMTVSPVMVETAEGPQVADFQVENHPGGSDSSRPGYQGGEYFVDGQGEVHHQYDHIDFESYDENREVEQDLPSEYIQNIQEMFGGPVEYAKATNWARQNLTEDFINEFNERLNSGDVDQMQPAFEELLSLYHGTDNEEAFEDQQPFDPELQSEIYQSLGGEEIYNQLTEWATNNLSEEAVNNYNLAMESGDDRLIRTAVQWLVGQYR